MPNDNHTTSNTETPALGDFQFQADVTRLLQMMVHSVYSDRSVFLRELLSNSADACEKLRFESLANPVVADNLEPYGIVISIDKGASSITVADNGIGMSANELRDLLGTIAHSGTREFLDLQKETGDQQVGGASATIAKPSGDALIGQFGVGFYSAFMVADTVQVISRRAGSSDAWKWSSDGSGTYRIELAAPESAPRQGTQVILHIRSDAAEYLDSARIEAIVREHSGAIQVPIDVVSEPGSAPRRIGDGAAIWGRAKTSVTPEEYTEFYRQLARQFDEPALTIHWRAEGRNEYAVLAFVPGSKPFDLFDPVRKGRAHLYVRRVLITKDAELLPAWLRFVSVVVDAADVPLNLSREMVQKSPIIAAIRKAIAGRILQEISNLAKNDAESFAKLWSNFGAVLKEGLYEDPERRDQILEVARFESTKSAGVNRTLKEYVASMRPNQTDIFYIAGDNSQTLLASPQLEGFRARGIEVLILSDPVDAFWTTTSLGFDGKPFKSITHGATNISAVDLEGPKANVEKADEAQLALLIAFAKQTLESVVSDVRTSDKLQESPACLVAGENAMDRRLERMLSQHGQLNERSKPMLELNPSHPLVRRMAERSQVKTDRALLEDALWLAFEEARLVEGEQPSDPAAFRQRLFRVMTHLLESSTPK